MFRSRENKYLLLVEWENLEAHTIGFRESEVYQEWKKMPWSLMKTTILTIS